MAKPMVAENYFVTKEKLIKLKEENQKIKEENQKIKEVNQKLKEEIEVLRVYNEQMQNEKSYSEEQADKYKEWYQVAKERVIRLETKLEAYKEIVKVIIKDCKNV